MRPGCSFEIIKHIQEVVLEQPEYARLPVYLSWTTNKIAATYRTGILSWSMMVTVMNTGPVDPEKLVPSAHPDKRYLP
jgi:hypothetical protein